MSVEAGPVVGKSGEVGVGGAAADAVVGCRPRWRGEGSIMAYGFLVRNMGAERVFEGD